MGREESFYPIVSDLGDKAFSDLIKSEVEVQAKIWIIGKEPRKQVTGKNRFELESSSL